jgi:hypothetical protein
MVPAAANPWAIILWHTARMPDDIPPLGERRYEPRAARWPAAALEDMLYVERRHVAVLGERRMSHAATFKAIAAPFR